MIVKSVTTIYPDAQCRQAHYRLRASSAHSVIFLWNLTTTEDLVTRVGPCVWPSAETKCFLNEFKRSLSCQAFSLSRSLGHRDRVWVSGDQVHWGCYDGRSQVGNARLFTAFINYGCLSTGSWRLITDFPAP